MPPTDQPTNKLITSDLFKAELDPVTVPREPTESFINRLFPLEELPVSASTAFNTLELTDYRQGKWIRAPPLDIAGKKLGQREEEVASYLQNLIKAISLSLPGKKKAPLRQWTSMFCGKAVGSDGERKMNRKPDLLVLKQSVVHDTLIVLLGRFGWRYVDLIGEIRNGPSVSFSNIHVDFANKGFCIFKHQWNRRFIIMYSLLCFLCKVSVYSRAGVVHCKPFDINKKPLLFLQVIMGLSFGSDSLIGFDPTFICDKSYQNCSVLIREDWYKIECPCWRSNVIQGRATQCFCVSLNDKIFVVKDVWICRYRRPTELYFYLRAQSNNVRNIPTLLTFWNVIVNGNLDCCEVGTGDDALVDRIHCRYLFKECGVPIWEFKSLKELINAFINYIEGKYYSIALLVLFSD